MIKISTPLVFIQVEFFVPLKQNCRIMKDKITWEDHNLFDYINAIEFLYVPDIDDYEYQINIEIVKSNKEVVEKKETPVFGYSEIVTIFKNRYNERKLFKQNYYPQYTQAVGHLLEELELDADKFWCLFLFAFDYCRSLYNEGLTMKATPLEQLNTLVNMIANEDKESMLLNFKAGKQKITVESPVALRFLADAIKNQLENADHNTIKCLYLREQDKEAKQEKDSPIIVYFAKILLDFFDTQDQIRNKRKKGAKHSLKEMDLVSQLVYFSNLSTNKSWTEPENETLKAFLKQYKDYKYVNNVSSIYPEFTIY